MISPILNPTTTVTRTPGPKNPRRWSSCWRRMLRPSARGVNGFGYGRPSRVPSPAARMTTFTRTTLAVNRPVVSAGPPPLSPTRGEIVQQGRTFSRGQHRERRRGQPVGLRLDLRAARAFRLGHDLGGGQPGRLPRGGVRVGAVVAQRAH